MDKEKVLRVVQLLKSSPAVELEVVREGLRVRVVRGSGDGSVKAAEAVETAESQPEGATADVEGILVTSHVVGFFRRAEEADAQPLAEPGQQVKAGQPIAAIEALGKIVSVKAPADGTLVEFLVSEGAAVEYGTPIARLRPVQDAE